MSVKTFKEGIKLDPQSADPTATEGQVQFSDGTVRPKGLYQYKDGAWASIGGGAGDADTIHLIKAADSQASDFTIKSIDDIMPDPEGSDTLAGTFSIPSSGSEALLSNDDDHKVFKFASAASSQYDAWGISKSIPRYVRGEDVVLQFKYRTADTSGDSADGDYMIWVWDETNGVNTTTTSTGSVSAGTAITVGTTTGMSVGDKIWVGETGGTAQVTEAHVTEVTSGTQVKISETVNLSSGDRFVTGILTDVLTTLDAADDDTNKTGNDFKVVFNVPSTCASVALLFQQLTSQTDSFLYVDNILVSSEVVKRVFARGQSEQYEHYTSVTAYGSTLGLYARLEAPDSNQLSKTLTVATSTTDGTSFTAKTKVKVSLSWTANYVSTAQGTCYFLNGTAISTQYNNSGSNSIHQASSTFIMNTGDVLHVGRSNNSVAVTIDDVVIVATPEVNDVVVVESTDSVISEWTSYTPTTQGFGTISGVEMYYRRVGNSMEIQGRWTAGTVVASEAQLGLPSGFTIDSSVSSVRITGQWANTAAFVPQGIVLATGGDTYLNFATAASSGNGLLPINGNAFAPNSSTTSVFASVPIAGWDANPKPLLAFPTITYGQDVGEYVADSHAGYGSTATKIPYFTNVTKNTVSNYGTVANDSTNGWSFTATKRCKVNISTMARMSLAGDAWGVSLNASSLTTNLYSLPVTEQVVFDALYASSQQVSTSATLVLEVGDVIRPHGSGGTVSSNVSNIRLTVEPEEGKVNQAAIISQPVAFVKDVKSSGTNGGSSSATTVHTRDLNTLEGDIAAVGVTLSSNQFTLPAGKYKLSWKAPAFTTAHHQTQLYNITDSVITKLGSSAHSGSSDATQTESFGEALVILTSSTTFEIRHYTAGSVATNGLGVETASQTSNTATENVYTQVKITRMK